MHREIPQYQQSLPLEFFNLRKLRKRLFSAPYLKYIYEAFSPTGEAVSHTIKLLKMSKVGVPATSISLFMRDSWLPQSSLGVQLFCPLCCKPLLASLEAKRIDRASFSFSVWLT